MDVEDFELSYREVIPDQSSTGARRDITVNTGRFLGYVLLLKTLIRSIFLKWFFRFDFFEQVLYTVLFRI